MWLGAQEGLARIDALGQSRTPFLFVLSYDKRQIFSEPLKSLPEGIYYELEGVGNHPHRCIPDRAYRFVKSPIPFERYCEAIDSIQEEIRAGNTYLLNYTCPTPIQTDLSLVEIFWRARAPFKLCFEEQFVCFSPERFIEIDGTQIATYPMKGTIDARLPDAAAAILANPKEQAEHVMIVDLMRNDLGMVAEEIRVESFRMIDQIVSGETPLLQVSSKITGRLPDDWHGHLGALLDRLTPAGSISGTPKRRTVSIIDRIEHYDRGLYTGIFGLYDGNSLRSGVMIRYIEKIQDHYYYKSGGGITLDSDAQEEYREMVDKVYLPF
jgi:para-aminobenzoate synthetase component 1